MYDSVSRLPLVSLENRRITLRSGYCLRRIDDTGITTLFREKLIKKRNQRISSSQLWWMDDPTLQDLVRELRAIRIREAQIIERIEGVLAETPNEGAKEPSAPPTKKSSHGLKIGDRIVITNKINRPANWPRSDPWIESEHKTATIREIIRISPTNTQIHFITDGGVETWRAPNNVRTI